MKLSNFVWLLLVIVVIAILSLIYTSATNDDEPQVDETPEPALEVSADVNEELNEAFEGVEYPPYVFNNSFEHTVPGEYSTINVDVGGLEPGQFTIMYVRKAGTEEYIEAGGQEHRVDENGKIVTSFPITEYGDYEVFFSYKGESVTSPILTVN